MNKPEFILVGLTGAAKGREFLLIEQEAYIGRTKENDICLSEHSVSRQHVRIQVKAGQVFAEDLESKNGTFINSTPISSSLLCPEDILHVGESRLRLKTLNEDTSYTSKPKDFFKTTPAKLMIFMISFLIPLAITKYSQYRNVRSKPSPNLTKSTPTSKAAPPISSETLVTPDPIQHVSDQEIKKWNQTVESALTLGDYSAAYFTLRKLSKARPDNVNFQKRLQSSEKELQKQIAYYDENGIREYEKLNYDRAIIQWRQVLALSKDYKPELYQKVELKIKEAEAKLTNKSN